MTRGAARLFDQARRLCKGAAPFVLPVGLHHGAEDRGRSTVLVRFSPPLSIPIELAGAPANEHDAARYARFRKLQLVSFGHSSPGLAASDGPTS